MPTSRIDLHVHTHFTRRPTDWILQRLLPSDSYTKPGTVYGEAQTKAMDFVTVTDLNDIQGALWLQENHPETSITGVEVTTRFPEDGCKVNILVFGFDEDDYREIQRTQRDIRDLRDFLCERRIAHSVAHPLHSLNGRLNVENLEKLILLFNVFEGINGARGRVTNQAWVRTLRALSPEKLEDLSRRHRIDPIGLEPWRKAFTGGSDDRCGVFIGGTWTEVEGTTKDEVLQSLFEGRCLAKGRSGDFRSHAFSTLKVAYDRKPKKSTFSIPALFIQEQLSEMLFKRRKFGVLDRLKVATLNAHGRLSKQKTTVRLAELLEACGTNSYDDVDARVDVTYEKLGELVDEYVRGLLDRLEKSLESQDVQNAVKGLAASIPTMLLCLPFFNSLGTLYRERTLTHDLWSKHGKQSRCGKRILWFTDTINDLNGPSVTLRKIGWLAEEKERDIHIVSSFAPEDGVADLPPDIINLPFIRAYELPFYSAYKINVPSVLPSLELLTRLEPDEIYVSTPGPVGVMGFLLGRILKTRVSTIFHTDFLEQCADIVSDDSILGMLEDFIRWFYNGSDRILVPTHEYMGILGRREYDESKMQVFRRGVDRDRYRPVSGGERWLREHHGVKPGFTLLYVGRVSREKRLEFLVAAYREAIQTRPDLNLVLTGDGPYLDELKNATRDLDRVHFTGRQGSDVLPVIYSAADLFVFPSTSDTFGMAVLEAQSCGLPALVSDVGGPKEILDPERTGWVLPATAREDWVAKILELAEMKRSRLEEYRAVCQTSRERAIQQFDWDAIIDEYTRGPSIWSDEPESSRLEGSRRSSRPEPFSRPGVYKEFVV